MCMVVGFQMGDRDGGHKLARHLAEQDMACACITYTLYMKDKSFGCDGILSEKIKAIQIAASQLWHATSFLIEKSEQFQIDTTRIFIAGSSAGAETVLHAAHWDRNQMQAFDRALSSVFQICRHHFGCGSHHGSQPDYSGEHVAHHAFPWRCRSLGPL